MNFVMYSNNLICKLENLLLEYIKDLPTDTEICDAKMATLT